VVKVLRSEHPSFKAGELIATKFGGEFAFKTLMSWLMRSTLQRWQNTLFSSLSSLQSGKFFTIRTTYRYRFSLELRECLVHQISQFFAGADLSLRAHCILRVSPSHGSYILVPG